MYFYVVHSLPLTLDPVSLPPRTTALSTSAANTCELGSGSGNDAVLSLMESSVELQVDTTNKGDTFQRGSGVTSPLLEYSGVVQSTMDMAGKDDDATLLPSQSHTLPFSKANPVS